MPEYFFPAILAQCFVLPVEGAGVILQGNGGSFLSGPSPPLVLFSTEARQPWRSISSLGPQATLSPTVGASVGLQEAMSTVALTVPSGNCLHEVGSFYRPAPHPMATVHPVYTSALTHTLGQGTLQQAGRIYLSLWLGRHAVLQRSSSFLFSLLHRGGRSCQLHLDSSSLPLPLLGVKHFLLVNNSSYYIFPC